MSQVEFVKSLAAAAWRERHWSGDDFKRLQEVRLRHLLRHSRQNVPLQAERLRHISVDALVAKGLSDIAPVSKQCMMERFDDTLADRSLMLQEVQQCQPDPAHGLPVLRGRYLISRTSGTTGETGIFVNDFTTWARQRGSVMARTIRDRLAPRHLARFAFGRRYRMAFLVTSCGFSVSRQSALTPMTLGRLFANIRTFSSDQPPELLAAELNQFRPHFLHCYPTMLQDLLESIEPDAVRFQPEIISCGSEALRSLPHEAIRRAFPKAIITSQYGTTECITMGNYCSVGRMHQNMDCCIVEPTQSDGTSTPVGEFSDHILITNLLNPVQPIIRYRVDDSVRVLGEPCPCGCALPVIEVQGRSYESFDLLDNQKQQVTLFPLVLDLALHKCSGIAQFQAIHESKQLIRLKFVSQKGAEPGVVADSIERVLREVLRTRNCGQSVELQVECVAAIPRSGEGEKFRNFVSNVIPAT